MGRKKGGAPATAGGRPAPGPGLIDGKILFIAALVASPAAYRASQGLLSIDQVLERYLLVALACAATGVVARALWSVLAGPVAPPRLTPPEDDVEGDADPRLP